MATVNMDASKSLELVLDLSSPDTTPPSVAFAAPTPNNNADILANYIDVNALLSENPGTCLLNWQSGSEAANLTMAKSGMYCSRNMTGLANGTYQFRVYATDRWATWQLRSRQNTWPPLPAALWGTGSWMKARQRCTRFLG